MESIKESAEKFLAKQDEIKEYTYAYTTICKFIPLDGDTATFIEKSTGRIFAVLPKRSKIEFPPKWFGNKYKLEDVLSLDIGACPNELIDISKSTYEYMNKVIRNMDKEKLKNDTGLQNYLKFSKENNIEKNLLQKN